MGLIVNAQGAGTTITVSTNPSECYNSNSHTYETFSGSGANVRYEYWGDATGGAGPTGGRGTSVVKWVSGNNRWEIQIMGEVQFYNTTPSKPKPPVFGFGAWTNAGNTCTTTLTGFSGSGTQNALVLPIELTQFDVQNTEGGKTTSLGAPKAKKTTATSTSSAAPTASPSTASVK